MEMIMKRWMIRYKDTDGGVSSCWVSAETREDAIEEARDEYWDIDEIESCFEIEWNIPADPYPTDP